MDPAKLEALLAAGQDNALLRFTLGNARYQERLFAEAERHLARAVELDPQYSAAWKMYGRALAAAGRPEPARAAFERGIAVARARGDVQAAREMTVFLKRLGKPDPS